MTVAGVGDLAWLILAVLLGLVVVIAWIIKSEINRNFLKTEIRKLISQLESNEREKVIIIEEMNVMRTGANASSGEQAPADVGPGNAMIGKMVERVDELEKDNERLKRELNEAKGSLEEVYKALCSK